MLETRRYISVDEIREIDNITLGGFGTCILYVVPEITAPKGFTVSADLETVAPLLEW